MKMPYGFVKAAAASPKLIVADVDYNVTEIIENIYGAYDKGVKLLVFPELSITGSTCKDLFFQESLIEAAKDGLQDILDVSASMDMVILVGLPWEKDGRLYNVTAVLKNGSIMGIVPKTMLTPDEARYFEAGNEIPEMILTGLFYGIDTEEFFDEDRETEDEENEPDGSQSENESYEEENGCICTYCYEDMDDEDCGYDEDFEEEFEEIEAPFGANLIFEAEDEKGFSLAVETGADMLSICPDSIRHTLAGALIIAEPASEKASYRCVINGQESAAALSARLKNAIIYAGAGCLESTSDGVCTGLRIIASNGNILNSGSDIEEAEEISRKDEDELSSLTFADIDVYGLYSVKKNSSSSVMLYDDEIENEYVKISFDFEEDEDEDDREASVTLSPNPFLYGETGKPVENLLFQATLGKELDNILNIQALGLKKRFEHTGSKKAVIGLSGGLDSALTLIVTARAFDMMGKNMDDIICVSMPSFGTSDRTHNNSKLLAEAFSTEFREINISESVRLHFKNIGHDESIRNSAYENAQARERTQILLDIANDEGGMMVGTGDMSEIALGWCTFAGDHISNYSVNAGVPKTIVRCLVSYVAVHFKSDNCGCNKAAGDVLADILDTPVSPELVPGSTKGGIAQKTEDIIGPYELHDFFLYYVLRYGMGPADIFHRACAAFVNYEKADILKYLEIFFRRFISQQFKKNTSVDGPKVFGVSLSPVSGFRMPSDASASLWLSEIECLKQIEL